MRSRLFNGTNLGTSIKNRPLSGFPLASLAKFMVAVAYLKMKNLFQQIILSISKGPPGRIIFYSSIKTL